MRLKRLSLASSLFIAVHSIRLPDDSTPDWLQLPRFSSKSSFAAPSHPTVQILCSIKVHTPLADVFKARFLIVHTVSAPKSRT